MITIKPKTWVKIIIEFLFIVPFIILLSLNAYEIIFNDSAIFSTSFMILLIVVMIISSSFLHSHFNNNKSILSEEGITSYYEIKILNISVFKNEASFNWEDVLDLSIKEFHMFWIHGFVVLLKSKNQVRFMSMNWASKNVKEAVTYIYQHIDRKNVDPRVEEYVEKWNLTIS